MSFYNAGSQSARLVEHGWPIYLFGSHQTPGGQMYVTSVSVASNVGIIGVTSWSGGLPIVGSTIVIRGTQTNSGLFNATNAVITAVNLDVNGTGTISYAVTNANIATTPDIGLLTFQYPVVGDTIATGASHAGTLSNMFPGSMKTVFADVILSSGVTASSIVLQTAMRNFDAEYVDAVPVIGQVSYQTNAPFVRFRVASFTGSGTIVGRVTI